MASHEKKKREDEPHPNELKARHQLNRVYDVLPLHFPVIDFISDRRYSPCPEFNRGLCQASHPHENDREKDGKPLDAICEICRYSLNLNNPHPAHECKLSRGLDNILARRKRKYEEDENRRERESREVMQNHKGEMRREKEAEIREKKKHRPLPPPPPMEDPRPGPAGGRRFDNQVARREQPPYSWDWGQKRPRNW